ncbi:MAG: DUF2130 domain-containing protein [Oligoflexia bacterium]|nr:DUF2130 domain-containing protein [Oligoflexia bacterium]MBF0365714.1 DUF2130 domain-containing protein [Oligoflexia bacterium]
MTKNHITCPKCQTQISIGDAIGEELRKEYEQKLISSLEKTRAEVDAKIRQELERKSKLQLEALAAMLAIKEKELLQAQQNELEMRKQRAEVEAKEKRLELELLRKLDEERKALEESVAKRITEDYHLKIAEKDKQLTEIARQLEESKRRAEQSNSRIKGDVFEEDLRAFLKKKFDGDEIEAVDKGKKGADVLHTIFYRGAKIASLLWEAKNTVTWQNAWIEKLKEDQRANKTEYAILVSKVLPSGASGNFFIREGVFITDDLEIAYTLAYTLKMHFIQLHEMRLTLSTNDENLKQLFDYLSGTSFKQRIEVIVERLLKLRENIARERAAMEKLWAQREGDYQKILLNTAGLYGEIKSISNDKLPEIAALELDPSSGAAHEI